MHYYAIYGGDGSIIINKLATRDVLTSPKAVEITKEEFDALNVKGPYELQQLHMNLTSTDYIACKIAEGAATREDYADVLAQRAKWRTRINELMGE